MDMINFSPFSKEKGGFDVYSISVKKQVEMENEVSSDDNSRNDVDCFKELCKKFPSASFAVEDMSLECTDSGWLPERFSGDSHLENFSALETVSIAFDEKIFEKAANDSEFMECLIKFVENLNNQWNSRRAQCLSDGMNNMHVEVRLKEDGTFGYHFKEYQEPFRLFDIYFESENNLSELQADDTAKRILEEYERQKQEGLFAMMDKIHQNSKELNEQIEHDRCQEKLKMEEYEKTFLFKI